MAKNMEINNKSMFMFPILGKLSKDRDHLYQEKLHKIDDLERRTSDVLLFLLWSSTFTKVCKDRVFIFIFLSLSHTLRSPKNNNKKSHRVPNYF